MQKLMKTVTITGDAETIIAKDLTIETIMNTTMDITTATAAEAAMATALKATTMAAVITAAADHAHAAGYTKRQYRV